MLTRLDECMSYMQSNVSLAYLIFYSVYTTVYNIILTEYNIILLYIILLYII